MNERSGRGDLAWLYTENTLARFDVQPHGVLHIGAHEGQEIAWYAALRFAYVDLVEPDPPQALMNVEERGLDMHVRLHALAVANVPRAQDSLFVREANTHQSHLGRGRTEFLVRTAPLSYVQTKLAPEANVLVVDTSGTELDVLKSGDLSLYDMVVVETDPTEVHASSHDAVMEHMIGFGFRPEERWSHGAHPYGDVVFIRGLL